MDRLELPKSKYQIHRQIESKNLSAFFITLKRRNQTICSSNGALSLTMNTLTPYPTKAPVRSSMPTRKKFRTASSKNIRRSGKRKRLRRATLTAAVRHSRTAQRTSRRERSPRAKSEAATPSVPHRRKKKLLPM